MKTSSVSLALVTVMLLAVPALAEQEATPMVDAPVDKSDTGGGKMMKKNLQELIKRFDKNGDGKLDEEEKAAAHKAMRTEGGVPGGLSEADRRKAILKRFDKNGDGRLDDEERAEAEKAREMVQRNGGGDRFRALIMKRFDKNGDGKLDEEEKAAAQKFRAEQLKKFDKDGDGKLDDEEREAALKAFMADQPPAPPKEGV